MKNFLKGLILGGILGLLFAPKRGSELRNDLMNYAEEIRDDVMDTATTYKDIAQEAGSSIKDTTAEAASSIHATFNDSFDHIKDDVVAATEVVQEENSSNDSSN